MQTSDRPQSLHRHALRVTLLGATIITAIAVGGPAGTGIDASASTVRQVSGARRSDARRTLSAASESDGGYAPNEILVKFTSAASRQAQVARAHRSDTAQAEASAANTRVLRLPAHASMSAALTRLRREQRVEWAVPNYVAHATGDVIPDDEGDGHAPGDWQQLQWNFVGQFGVNAPEAWANVAADGAAGGSGVTVAVLDTGVAYANRGPFRRSPDFSRYTFVQGYDFVAHNPYPNDRNGHGTFVASTIAESTDNHIALTGLAYGAHIMPVRVLDSQGEGDAATIAEGVRFAVNHHAQVINLSLEFSSDVTASDIPELIEALRYAHRRGVLVVAAAGNEGHAAIAYPARAPDVVAVGATTEPAAWPTIQTTAPA